MTSINAGSYDEQTGKISKSVVKAFSAKKEKTIKTYELTSAELLSSRIKMRDE